MNVSNARMNIPKDMMSLKSKFFIGITSNPFGRRSTHPVHGVPWKSFYHGAGIFTMVLSCEASLITEICHLAYPAHSIYLFNSLWDIYGIFLQKTKKLYLRICLAYSIIMQISILLFFSYTLTPLCN